MINIMKVYITAVFNYTRKHCCDVYFYDINFAFVGYNKKIKKQVIFYIIMLLLEWFCM